MQGLKLFNELTREHQELLFEEFWDKKIPLLDQIEAGQYDTIMTYLYASQLKTFGEEDLFE